MGIERKNKKPKWTKSEIKKIPNSKIKLILGTINFKFNENKTKNKNQFERSRGEIHVKNKINSKSKPT